MTVITSPSHVLSRFASTPAAGDPGEAGQARLSLLRLRWTLQARALLRAGTAFNTPQTLEEIFKNNDVQLFDLQNDPDEMHNLTLEPEKNQATILRMNGLLNELMAKEVGVNDGRFLPQDIRPK